MKLKHRKRWYIGHAIAIIGACFIWHFGMMQIIDYKKQEDIRMLLIILLGIGAIIFSVVCIVTGKRPN